MTNFCQACGGQRSLYFSTLPGCRCVNPPPINYVINQQIKREWVGLTEREVELIDEMIETQLLHAERCDHMANSTMAQKQKAWDLERVELLRKLKEKNQ